MNPELKNKLISLYSGPNGSKKLYDYLIYSGIKLLNEGANSPEIILLQLYQQFYGFYLSENSEKYINIAKICRKAAHKLYRILLKKGKTNKNEKFLNLIK